MGSFLVPPFLIVIFFSPLTIALLVTFIFLIIITALIVPVCKGPRGVYVHWREVPSPRSPRL